MRRHFLICLAAVSSLLASPVFSASDDWRVYVAFVEEELGAINRLPKSYEMAWVLRNGDEKALGKAFKNAQKATVEGTKNKIYTREATTNSTEYLAIFEYTRDFTMWKGSPKRMSALKMVKGNDLDHLKKQMDDSAAEYDYHGYTLVTLIDLQFAKRFLNAQSKNPFFGTTPPVTLE